MKLKHNKKRNTAFVYEALIVEATVSMLKKNNDRHQKCVEIIKKHFNPNNVLNKELQCYKSLYENQNLDQAMSEKILAEAKINNRMIDPNKLFDAQTDLINDVNKEISPSVFNTFVPNYKTLATIHQIFSPLTEPKNKVILDKSQEKKMME